MSEQEACAHERKTQTKTTDQRETGPVTTVQIKCDDCGKVTSAFAV